MKLKLNHRVNLIAVFAATASAAIAAPGGLDTTFNVTGKATANYGGTETAGAVAVAPDGKIVAAGTTSALGNNDIAVIRYNSNGTLDTSFSNDGGVITDTATSSQETATAVAIQKDGKILVAGYTNFAGTNDVLLIRYNKDGSLDTFFGINGKVIINSFNDDRTAAIAIQPDGKILVAGTEGVTSGNGCDFSVRRFLTTGEPDNAFGTLGRTFIGFPSAVDFCTSLALQQDGKIVLAGYTNSAGTNDFAITRLNSNGLLDNTFDVDGLATVSIGGDDRAAGVVIQKDGKIVVAGSYDDGASDFAIARFNASGGLDPSFSVGGTVYYTFGVSTEFVRSLLLQPDGKLIITGYSNFSGTNDFAVMRLKANGDLDPTFDVDGRLTTNVGTSTADTALAGALQPNGKLLVAGNSGTDFAIARYNMLVKTDAMVGKTTSASTGNNIYNNTGASQTLALPVKKKGGKATSYVRIQNDGHDTGAFKIKGTAGNGSFDVKYFNGTTDVTTTVKAGTFSTGNLAAGSSFLLKVQITAKTKKAKQNRSFFITGTSAVDSSSVDTVLIKAASK